MSTTDTPDPEELEVAKSHLGFPVVGIGASAGGIDALRRLLESLPADSGMAFVIVMHLSPDHESALPSILQRACGIPVTAVSEATSIEADHVYVISPAMKLSMSDGGLRVSALTTMEGRRQSIDLFFRSLAQAHRERAVCVVLSGTGSDGAQGLKRIKELGGVALAQSPEDAEFDGMPRAAAQTGQVDFVLPVSEMPAKLMLLWENAKRIELPDPPSDMEARDSSAEANVQAEEALLSIKALLRERTGHDFAHYKRATVLRRLERRMQVNALPDLPSYRRLLDSEPRETPALLQDMLISVTYFFRDPDSFDALSAALKSSLPARPTGDPFRAWVAGCATGEEAYSIAILLRELLGPSAPPIQVFASDIDQRAVAFARVGLYPDSIEADVSAGRLQGFFIPDPAGFKVSKPVREAVVFSTHNVLSDPSFTRMDLICCRNLMIYLDRSAQEQLLRGLHYALKPRGFLFLGSSETADVGDGLFEPVDRVHRVYRASATPARQRAVPTMSVRLPILELPTAKAPSTEASSSPLEALHDVVLRDHAPPTLLVDADDTVLHVSKRATHLLRLPEGAPTNKLMALARPELRAELRAAMLRAAQTGKVVEAPRVRLAVNGETREVVMRARPITREESNGLILVEFDESLESLASVTERDPVVESLEAELQSTLLQLRGKIGESAASTEELRASNEELQTINEELRSTTEELETSREELQAVNEELTTVNGELTVRVEEATKADDDWRNLLASAEIGTVFVDRRECIKRFTPQSATLFNLLPSDLGRPLLDITHRMDYPQLAGDVADVLRDLKRVEREIRVTDGRRIIARAVPYRTGDDRIEGAVLAFFDVTALRAAEDSLLVSERRMALIAESMQDYAIMTMDTQGHITSWSSGAERIFGYTVQEAVGKPSGLIFAEEDRAAGVPGEELRLAARMGRASDDRWLVTKSGDRIFCSGVTTGLGEAAAAGFAKITRNFTAEEMRHSSREAALANERMTSGRLQELSVMKDEFLAIVSHELKNPLSVIQMNAQLLSRMPGLAADPRALRSTQSIMSSVASQAQIIDDLLELSRANMGKITLAPSLLDLTELAGGIVEAADTDARTKGQTLSSDLEQATLFGDRVRIEQIVWNLVANAIKFTPEGGSVHVSLRANVDGMVRLSVQDSGIGIDPRDLANIFDMFHQVESGTARTKTGLGIGLALVKQLAELHGGRVAADSEGVGRGTSFTVWLPLPAAESPRLPEAKPEVGLLGLSVLVVDDEPQTLAIFGALLETEGVAVALAGSTREALRLAQAQAFDVIVSDIAMPGEDGFWLAKRLREDASTRGMTLVAVSGMTRAADRARAIEAGFDALLAKPIDFDVLRSEIVHARARRASLLDGPSDPPPFRA